MQGRKKEKERLLFLGAQHEDLLLDIIREVTKHFLIRFFNKLISNIGFSRISEGILAN